MSIRASTRSPLSGIRDVGVVAISLFAAACGTAHHEATPPDAVSADAPSNPGCPTELIGDVRASWYAFTGTVTALHQSTEPPPPDGIDPSWDPNKQAIVQITDVAMQPDEWGLLVGELDSIQFEAPPTFAVGYQGHFFGSLYVAGKSHVFHDQGHLDASAIATDAFDHWVKAAQQFIASHDLYERMIGAQAVALVTVQDAADIPGQPILDNGSDWWQAQVSVQSILYGTLPAGPIPVRFDHSQDFCCYQSPKLAPGDQAIVLLYTDAVTGLPGSSYVISQPIDLQPATTQGQLAALLAAPPSCPLLP
jgi:hypothetical protein